MPFPEDEGDWASLTDAEREFYEKKAAQERAQPPKLYAWKFFVPSNPSAAVPLPPKPGDAGELSVFGVGAVAISATEAGAFEALKRFAAQHGMDSRWLEVVRASRIELVEGAPLCMWQV